MNINDQEILKPLVARVLELSSLPIQEVRKKLWADHQALIKTPKIPICVYWEGIPTPQWHSLLGTNMQQCSSTTGKEIEFFLRKTIWTAENIPDDHIVWPMFRLNAPITKKVGWGLECNHIRAHNPLEAAALNISMKGNIDISLLTKPEWIVDENAWKQKQEEALNLTGHQLDLYPYYDNLGYSPFDIAANMRGLEQIMLDAFDDPEGLHKLMNFITTAIEEHHQQRAQKGWLNQQVIDRSGRYQPILEHRIHCAHQTHGGRSQNPNEWKKHEWPYVSAQCSSGFGPDMFAEFVQPYNARLVANLPYQTVYYHGCEILDQKYQHIKSLPKLRRTHVSPWTTVSKAVEVFHGTTVMEVHADPSKVFFGWGKKEIENNLRFLVQAGSGLPMNLNLSDIHSFNNKPETMTLWAESAQNICSEHVK